MRREIPGAKRDRRSIDSTVSDETLEETRKKLGFLLTESTGDTNVLDYRKRKMNPNLDVLNAAFDEGVADEAADLILEKVEAEREFNEVHPGYDTSFFVFNTEHPVRLWCIQVLGAPKSKRRAVISGIISAQVILSTVLLAYNSPFQRRMNLDA